MGNATASSCSSNSIKFESKSLTPFPSDVKDKCVSASVAFGQQQQMDMQQAMISHEGMDRRIRAPSHVFNDNMDNVHNAVHNIGIVRAKYGEKYVCGTGTIIHHSLNVSYVLTAAHNIVHVITDPEYSVIHPDKVWFFVTRNTGDNGGDREELAEYNAAECTVHPQYIERALFQHDIGIIKVMNSDNRLRRIQPMKVRSFQASLEEYEGIKVVGYPGEYAGNLYGMSGTVGYFGGDHHLMYYRDIDTSPGQSGAPIVACKSDEKTDVDDIFVTFDEIIGVHTGGNCIRDRNWGTVITDDKLKWVADVLQCDSFGQLQSVCCNALLISAHPRYEHAMNKLYRKFKSSCSINTNRLYIDPADENTVITKEMILSDIERIFADDTNRKSYIICYCGGSSADGNWLFDETDVSTHVSLQDILNAREIAMNKKSPQFHRLIIISDCSYSGCWVEQYKLHYRDNEPIDVNIIIQGSSRGEITDAGVFIKNYAAGCLNWEKKDEEKNSTSNTLRIVATGLGMLATGFTSGPLFDYGINKVYHQKTKKSVPTTTQSVVGIYRYVNLGESLDAQHKLYMMFFESWAEMDAYCTVENTMTYTSFGTSGNQL